MSGRIAACSRRPSSSRGFALPELLVASALSALLAGAVLAVVHPSNAAFVRMPAAGDLQQRLGAAADVLGARLLGACGAVAGGFRNPLGIEVPCVFPYGIGAMRARPPGAWHAATVSLLAGAPGALPAPLAEGIGPADALAQLQAGSCPAADAACGVRAGDTVVLVGPGARWELARVALVQEGSLTLDRAPSTNASFPAGSLVLPVDPAVFYLRAASGSDPPQLRLNDAAASDLPLLDHVVDLQVQFFGESSAPSIASDGSSATYGPIPPPSGIDDPGDAWGEGENCVFARAGGVIAPRLADLPGAPLGLVELPPAALADGPWCPDAASPARFDADLLRTRRLRVLLRLEVAPAQLRGRGPLFLRPGDSTSGLAYVPDREVVLEAVPRGAGGGR